MFNGMRYGRMTGEAAMDAAPAIVSVIDRLITSPDLPLPHSVADRLIGLANRDTAAHVLGTWVYYYFPGSTEEESS